MDEHNTARVPPVSARESDPEVIRMLFETYQDRVYSIALVFFKGNSETAKDVTQQVFLKLMTRIGQNVGSIKDLARSTIRKNRIVRSEVPQVASG